MKQNRTIGIASDHAGFQLKEAIKQQLEGKGFTVRDFGTHSEASTDYPDYVHPLAEAIEAGDLPEGVMICGSGEGVCMTANKHAGIRAALVWNKEVAALSRQHNNANVICLPARFISREAAEEFVDIFLATSFEGGRHERRVNKIPLAH
jgi:ribose 5-phosphate isomerase B